MCRFCGRGQEHPTHAFFECSADRLVTLRVALLADAAVAWDRLLAKIEEAYESTYRDVLPDATETRSELITAYSDAGDAFEASWLTYRLLWAIPWSALDVPSSARAATLRGATFDEVILSRHASRLLADSWVAWSSKWTRQFKNERVTTMNGHGIKTKCTNLNTMQKTAIDYAVDYSTYCIVLVKFQAHLTSTHTQRVLVVPLCVCESFILEYY